MALTPNLGERRARTGVYNVSRMCGGCSLTGRIFIFIKVWVLGRSNSRGVILNLQLVSQRT